MAEYLILIYGEEAAWSATATDTEAAEQQMKEYATFAERNGAALRGGNRLHLTTTATSIRPDGAGGVTVTDGPFVETKEALGGYYLIEADTVDEALEWAAKLPSVRYGTIEVRPLVPMTAGTPAG